MGGKQITNYDKIKKKKHSSREAAASAACNRGGGKKTGKDGVKEETWKGRENTHNRRPDDVSGKVKIEK